ncbi:hypothetical protein EDC01DRAFT_624915, partial [Geopyxis carbonaria]
FTVPPFGYIKSGAHIQRYIDRKLRHLLHCCMCYINDIGISSITFDGHLQHLRLVLETMQQARLYLWTKKCYVAYHSVTMLTRQVDRFGLSTMKEKPEAIQML